MVPRRNNAALRDVVHNHIREGFVTDIAQKISMNTQPTSQSFSSQSVYYEDEEELNSWIWGIKSNAWLIKL
jgi:hypothetical protein